MGAWVQAYGQIQQGEAQQGAAYYNANVARTNSKTALQNANIAGQAGEAQSAMEELKTRGLEGALKVNEGAGGTVVDTGSNADTRASASDVGLLNALTAKSEASKAAWGYQVQSKNELAQANLDYFQGNQSLEAGEIGATGTLIGAAQKAAGGYEQYQQYSGIGG